MRFLMMVFVVLSGVGFGQGQGLVYPVISSNGKSFGLMLMAEVTKYGVMSVGYNLPGKEDTKSVITYSGSIRTTTFLHTRESVGEVRGGLNAGWIVILYGFDLVNVEESTHSSDWKSTGLSLVAAGGIMFKYERFVIGIGAGQGVRGYVGYGI